MIKNNKNILSFELMKFLSIIIMVSYHAVAWFMANDLYIVNNEKFSLLIFKYINMFSYFALFPLSLPLIGSILLRRSLDSYFIGSQLLNFPIGKFKKIIFYLFMLGVSINFMLIGISGYKYWSVWHLFSLFAAIAVGISLFNIWYLVLPIVLSFIFTGYHIPLDFITNYSNIIYNLDGNLVIFFILAIVLQITFSFNYKIFTPLLFLSYWVSDLFFSFDMNNIIFDFKIFFIQGLFGIKELNLLSWPVCPWVGAMGIVFILEHLFHTINKQKSIKRMNLIVFIITANILTFYIFFNNIIFLIPKYNIWDIYSPKANFLFFLITFIYFCSSVFSLINGKINFKIMIWIEKFNKLILYIFFSHMVLGYYILKFLNLSKDFRGLILSLIIVWFCAFLGYVIGTQISGKSLSIFVKRKK